MLRTPLNSSIRNLIFAIILLTSFAYGEQPFVYVSKGQMVATGRLSPSDTDMYQAIAYFFGTQAAIMDSKHVQERAHAHLKATHAKLLAENPRIITYEASHIRDTAFFDLIVESDNPKYAQLYLQACMDEYLKLRKELQINSRKRNRQKPLNQSLS